MLEAFSTGYVGECEEEVVDVVVARVVGGPGLTDEVIKLGDEGGAEFGVFGAVGDYVDVVLRRDLGGECELVEVLAGDDGRVFELFDRGGGVVCGALGFADRSRQVGVSAVPMPQPSGTFTVGWIGISLTGVFAG